MWSLDKQRAAIRRSISGVVMESLEGRLLFSSTLSQTALAALANPVVPISIPTAPLPLQGVVGTPLSLDPAMVDAGYEFNDIGFTTPGGTEVLGNGAGTTIAIVDPFGSPTIANDLEVFDAHWGLSNNDASGNFCLSVDPLGGANVTPGAVATNGNWAEETALDVEWAHAVAPGAHIDLVEAPDTSILHLMDSDVYAANLPGVVDVSMSWGDDVTNMTEPALFDGFMVTPTGHQGVTFVAASGDGGQSEYPAASENVLSVGGLSVGVGLNGQIQTLGVWNNTFGSSGGGNNIYAPSWQEPYVALTADPMAGVWMYDSTPGSGLGASAPGWQVVGGTSFAAAAWSGLVSIIDQGIMLQGTGSLSSPAMINDILTLGERDPSSFITDWGGQAPTYPLYPVPNGPIPDTAVIPVNGNSGFGLPISESLAFNMVQLATGATTTFNAQTANALAFTQNPTNAQAGQTLSAITVTETGATLTGSVSISISELSPSQVPVLLGTTTVTAVNGVATFNNLSIDQAGTYELEVSSNGIVSTTSSQFTISAGTPVQLGFITQPTATWQFGPVTPPVVIGMEDQFGNVVTDSSNPVTLALESGPAGAKASGAGTEDASAGRATYSDLTFTQPGVYSLLAASAGLTSAVSDSFTVVGIPTTQRYLFNGAALGAVLILQQEHRNASVIEAEGPPTQEEISAAAPAAAVPAVPAVLSSPVASPSLSPNAAAADGPGPIFSFIPVSADSSTDDDQLKDLLANN
jgi:hypothetical protein